jgi:hypothetical protein
MVRSETENVMKAETRGLVMVVQVFATVKNWLGVSGFIVGSVSGGDNSGEVFSPTFHVKIKVLP